jgi:hypothetical protein
MTRTAQKQRMFNVFLALATIAGVRFDEMLEMPATELQRRIRTRFAS